MNYEDAKQEFLKCKKDPAYFISNYIKIVHPIRGLVTFDLYPFQKRILKEVRENRFNILRKFRQAGCTTISSAYSLWFCIFHKHKTVAILSIGDAESTEVLERVKIMYDELPEWLKCGIEERNKHTVRFATKSIIRSRPSGKTSGRSLAGSLLIIDEGAFIERIDEIWASVYPIISTGGSVIVLSTVNGVGNWYHKLWSLAKEHLNKFHRIEIEWQEHPEYKYNPNYEHLYKELKALDVPPVEEWEETTKSNISYRKWLQEYEKEFLGTGETYVEGTVLRAVHETVNSDYYIRYNNRMRVWKDPVEDHEYLLAADSALGRERDYSAFHIIDGYTGEQVAEFYSNRTPINEFAEIIATEGQRYNLAVVAPERNTIGINLIEWLFDILEYENVWIDPYDNKMGVQQTQIRRETLLAKMEEYIRNEKFKINSKRTSEELWTFIIDDNGRAVADEGGHDDLVMSLAIASYVHDFLFKNMIMMPDSQRLHRHEPHQILTTKIKTIHGMEEEDYRWILS